MSELKTSFLEEVSACFGHLVCSFTGSEKSKLQVAWHFPDFEPRWHQQACSLNSVQLPIRKCEHKHSPPHKPLDNRFTSYLVFVTDGVCVKIFPDIEILFFKTDLVYPMPGHTILLENSNLKYFWGKHVCMHHAYTGYGTAPWHWSRLSYVRTNFFEMGWQAFGHSFQKIYNMAYPIWCFYRSRPVEWVQDQLNGIFLDGVVLH